MNVTDLIAALEANAAKAAKPQTVTVDGLGTIYIRQRTVAEFEETAATLNGEGGKFAPALARLLCDENGARLPSDLHERVAALLAQQPESVFRQMIASADGVTKDADAGN